MDPIPVPAGTARHSGTVNAWWRCQLCGTERYDVLAVGTLDVVGRRYHWPPGYRTSRDDMPDMRAWQATYLELVGVLSTRQAGEVRRNRRERWEASQ
jgi:hypothetical protein